MENTNTYEEESENVNKILFGGIFDTLNIFTEAGIFDDYSTGNKASN